MIEKNGVNQVLEKHEETRSDDYWKKIIEDFQKIRENEERMERQLELEEIQRLKEETRKLQEANKQVEDVNRQIEQMNQVMKQGIKAMLSNGMSLELISKSLSKSEDEIMELLKQCHFLISIKMMFLSYKVKMIIESPIIWRLFWCIIKKMELGIWLVVPQFRND